jgi:thiamine-phosphate pyrophosphorylase
MLQFIAEKSNRYSIAEQIEMAIKGGCAWVQLHLPDSDDTEIKDIVAEAVPICREAGIILTIEDRQDIAQEHGLHGVHITNPGANARQMRQDLGAEAIIGINVTSAQGVPTLEKLDIDYVTISPEMTVEQAKELVHTVRTVGCAIPIVLTGDYNCLDINVIREIGADGVSTGAKLMQAENPSEAVSQLITALKQ